MSDSHAEVAKILIKPFACGSCSKSFTRKSALKRHIASKRGDSWHAQEEPVSARDPGSGREKSSPTSNAKIPKGPKSSSENGKETKNTLENSEEDNKKEKEQILEKPPRKKVQTRSEISKAYNSKDSVREKNKARRRERDSRIRAQLAACDWYVASLAAPAENTTHFGKNTALEENPQFSNATEIDGASAYAFAVASNVPPAQWPELGGFPGAPHFAAAVGRLPSSELFSWHAEWEVLAPEQKKTIWSRECDRALRAHMPRATLCHVSGAPAVVRAKSSELAASYAQQAFLDELLTDSASE